MKAMLSEIIEEENKLITIDGRMFIIDPSEEDIYCTWIPTANLEIDIDKGIITNLENDSIIDILMSI